MVEHHGNLSEEAIAPCRSPLFTTWNILGGGAGGGRKKQDGAQVKKHHKMVRCPKGTALSTVHIARFVMFSQYVQMGETF